MQPVATPIRIRQRPRPVQRAAPPVNPFPEIPDPFGYGQRAVDYIRSLKHPLSTLPGNAYPLDPWAEKIIRQIYGPRHPNGSRIVKRVYMLVPRGNRKTTLTAAITMLHGKGPERRPGAQLVSVAVDKKQAKGVFKEVAGIIDGDYADAPNVGNSAKTIDEARGAKIREYTSKITFSGGIEYEALSSDAGTAQGRTPSLVIADEIHAWMKRDPRELWAAMKLGAGKAGNSLMVVTTTAGAGKENLAFDVIDYARKVARGIIDDPATLPVLFEAPRNADWKDEAVWHEVNPGLAHGYPDLETLRQEVREAEHIPAERAKFQRYRLNIWQDSSSSPFVDMDIYDRGSERLDLSDLENVPCWLGVDLSSKEDLTAIVACWRTEDDGYIVYPWFFCPEDNLQKKADKAGVPYPRWAEEDFIEPTPGDQVDFRLVEATIRELCERFDVKEVCFDNAMAAPITGNLGDDGYAIQTMPQRGLQMARAIKEVERAIMGGKFRHGGHPILRWCFDNVHVVMNKYNDKEFHRGKSTNKIDGAVAAAMAVSRAVQGEGSARSIFDDPNITAQDLVW